MPYAFLEGDTPVEIHAGAPFATPEIVVSEDDGAYYAPKSGDDEAQADPLAAGTVVQIRTMHPRNALELYSPEDLARYRIQHFAEPAVPVGKAIKTRELVVDAAGLISVNVTFEDAPPPEVVELLRIKIALLDAAKLDDVEAAMATAEDAIRIRWQSATEVHRDSAMAAAIADAASMEIDTLFVAASLVEV